MCSAANVKRTVASPRTCQISGTTGPKCPDLRQQSQLGGGLRVFRVPHCGAGRRVHGPRKSPRALPSLGVTLRTHLRAHAASHGDRACCEHQPPGEERPGPWGRGSLCEADPCPGVRSCRHVQGQGDDRWEVWRAPATLLDDSELSIYLTWRETLQAPLPTGLCSRDA